MMAPRLLLLLPLLAQIEPAPVDPPVAIPSPAPVATVEQIGDALMTLFVLPLELVGLLLTAALMGSVMIAMQEGEDK